MIPKTAQKHIPEIAQKHIDINSLRDSFVNIIAQLRQYLGDV